MCVHAEVCMTRLSAETQHEERCHCEFVTDSVNLRSEGEKKRGRERERERFSWGSETLSF